MSEKKQNTAMLRVGFIGAGLMGHGIAKNILEKGKYPLTVIANRNRAPIEDLIGRGAHEAKSLAEIAENSDIVFLCLPSSDAVKDVVYREDGLFENLRQGMIVVDTSTSLPDVTQSIAEEMAKIGVAFIDAPLGRSPKEAEEGRLGSYVGGEAEIVEKVIPIIDCYSEIIVKTGPVGSAMTGKIINTFIAMANCAVIAEAVATGARFGLDFDIFYQIVSSSGANSRMFQQIMPWVLNGDTSGLQGHLRTSLKDITYYSKLAESVNAASFVGAPITQLFRHANSKGFGGHYLPVLPGIVAALNGDEIRPIKKPGDE